MRMQINLENVQTVTPQMIESMAVLQCGTQELKEHLEALSYENPMMDLQEPSEPEPELSELADRLRWLKSSDRQNRSYYSDSDRDSVDQYLRAQEDMSLSDYLKEQILTLDVDAKLRRAMEMVSDLLDERGLYTGTVSEIARLARCPAAMAGEALAKVRQLEPSGVAAGSIEQSLLTQLMSLEVRNKLAERMIREQFSHLASWSDQRLARALGVSEQAVQAGRQTLASLNPYPSNGFAASSQIQYVTPDLYIAATDDGVQVTAEERYLPTIHISGEYLGMLETEEDQEVRKYLKQKLVQVERLISDVDRRKSTVLRCGEVIAARQKAFFQGGELRTLTLREVAEELELHESTISRAVKNKYVQCERGLYPMSWFFQREAGQNYGMGRRQIQSVMSEIIAGEKPQKPLSDQKISEALAGRHIILSRRGVAKYRAELGIPPASARKHTI